MNKELLAQARQRIEEANTVLVITHVRPDGDAVGSLLAMGLALEGAGKAVQMVLVDGVPSSFRHLKGADRVLRQGKGQFDLIIGVDAATKDRLGEALEGDWEVDINIDHHPSNTDFGEINLVEVEAVSTTAILSECFPAFGLPVTQPIAEALLTGLVTDTNGFRTSNMTPHALRLAADLMEKGADLPELYRQALGQRSYEATRYWGAGLLKTRYEDGIAWTSLTLADRKEVGYNGKDDADLVNVLSAVEGAEVAVIFVEQNPTKVKISWRGNGNVDLSRVAAQFGGGGHVAAAGAMIEGSLEEVQKRVLEATRAAFARVPVS